MSIIADLWKIADYKEKSDKEYEKQLKEYEKAMKEYEEEMAKS
jgi:hypothetical protein